MKSVNMKAPALSEIYTQKILREAHKKKLSQIRQERKSFIGFDNNRVSNIQNLKDSKSRSFALKFNQQSTQINKQNLKFLARLQKTKPYFRYTSHDHRESANLNQSRDSHHNSFVTPYIKRQIQTTQRQNARLTNRVHSVSSTLNQKDLMKDFVKSQRIKSRITRYAEQNNKVLLKSQKYISNLSNSKLSDASAHSKSLNKVKAKSTAANYYRRQDILKNKIQSNPKQILRLKNKVTRTLDQNNQQNKESFFSTQPLKATSFRRKTKK